MQYLCPPIFSHDEKLAFPLYYPCHFCDNDFSTSSLTTRKLFLFPTSYWCLCSFVKNRLGIYLPLIDLQLKSLFSSKKANKIFPWQVVVGGGSPAQRKNKTLSATEIFFRNNFFLQKICLVDACQQFKIKYWILTPAIAVTSLITN